MIKKTNYLLIVIGVLAVSSCNKTSQDIFYQVTWLNEDGSILEVDEKVKKDSFPHYDGATPSKESDDIYDYVFASWDKELVPVTSDITYIATYTSLKRSGYITTDHSSGFYDEPFLLSLEAPRGFDIYYTLDNSDPSILSTKYSNPIRIDDASNKPNYYSLIENISPLDVYYPSSILDKCQIVKAVAINSQSQETSEIYQYNYFVDYQNKSGYQNMPIITLNVNDDDLFDYEKGIYVTGKIYDESEHTGYPETYPANYQEKGKGWERKANFKYFDSDKSLTLEQDIGIRIHGGWSRAFNQKSFNLYARKDYSGSSTFNYQFFEGINAHSLMLRSGGYRDTDLTKVRDSLNHDLSIKEKFDIQRSFPTIVFLNGEYWGIYNLQERYSDHYVEEHHGNNNKDILIIKNDEIDEGKEEDYHYYEELLDFFKNNDFSNADNYLLASQYIDMEEFASYMSTELYVGNIDWPGNNVRVYLDTKTPNSKWHFMMYDTDDSSNILPSKCDVSVDPFLKTAHWKSGPLEEDCLLGLLLSRLIESDTFKALFRETFIRIGQENFAPNKVNSYLNDKISLLSEPMVKNYQRFVNNDYDSNYFINKVNIIKSFFNDRYEYALEFLNTHIPE